MLALSAKRLAYLASGEYTECRCVRLVRKDGVVIAVTTHHRDLDLNGTVYRAGTGYGSSAIQSTASLSVDNMEVSGSYGAVGISRADLEGGLYHDSKLFMFDTDYTDPVEDEHPKKSGHQGDVTIRDSGFTIEFRSLAQALQQPTGRLFTRSDDFTLAAGGIELDPPAWSPSTGYAVRDAEDARVGDTVRPIVPNGYVYLCTAAGQSGASEPSWTTTGLPDVVDGGVVWQSLLAPVQSCVVTAVTDQQIFDYSGSVAPDGYLARGEVLWTSGSNTGLRMEITTDSSGEVQLFMPMPSPIQVGDSFDATLGYDRSWETLRDRFHNIRNYGGFPFIPGPNAAARLGGQG